MKSRKIERNLWGNVAQIIESLLRKSGIEQQCRVCRLSSKEAICRYCLADLDHFNLPHWQNNLLLHPTIAKGLLSDGIDQLVAISDYRWPYSQLITGLKFSRSIEHAPALAQLFQEQLKRSAIDMPDAILPVPLHKQRLCSRGFNQAHEVARLIAAQNNCTVLSDHLERNKATAEQTTLTRKQRLKNLRDAFSLKKPLTCDHLVIFDDVVTTGATTQAIADMLKSQYPHMRIDIWCLCITLEH